MAGGTGTSAGAEQNFPGFALILPADFTRSAGLRLIDRGQTFHFFSDRLRVFALEFVHAAGRVDQLLLTREKWVAA